MRRIISITCILVVTALVAETESEKFRILSSGSLSDVKRTIKTREQANRPVQGELPLSISLSSATSSPDVAKYMIEKGAIDPQNPGPVFVEMYGRYAFEVDLVQLLIAKGAVPLQSDIDEIEKIKAANSWLKHSDAVLAVLRQHVRPEYQARRTILRAPLADKRLVLNSNGTDRRDAMPVPGAR